ncbi:MAG: segregation/condensation protein A [Caldilinea sp.]|nr:segregation/condensation protein A [Caldilineaceae bacterium]MCB9120309.1 segregation/condensation protein A [Caldilineaceae bacterium]MCB9125651.1 segregation/condensation protein A [Caldilineaceae bacterium]MCW5844686.1 segregation/condensation protein A [Caldilinea sp.]
MTTPISNRDQTLGAGYAVTLPVYEGPLDLLLRMIETQEMDISVVSLMSVTDQYLRTLNQLEEIEAGALAEFLVIASRLLYIKSYHLLPKPRPPVDDEEEASGDALVRQLLEYRRFKEAASALRLREEAGMRVYLRTAPRPDVEKRLDLSNVDLEKLQRALRKVLQRMPVDPPMPRVKTYTITVSEQIENVRSYLYAAMNAGARTRRGVSFEALLSRSATRIEVIVTFLAVLELVKLREIEVVQDDTFGEIELVPVTTGEAGATENGMPDDGEG